MDSLPLLIEDPVQALDGSLHLVLPGRAPLPVRSDSGPMRRFNQGWRAESLSTLLDPLWLLVLRHEDGDAACWFLTDGGALAQAPWQRPEAQQRPFRQRMAAIALWTGALDGAAIRLPVPEPVRAYAALPPSARAELDRLLDAPAPRVADLAPAEAPPPVVVAERDGEAGRWRLGNPDALVTLRNGDAPAELLPGWEVERVSTALAPLLGLVLRHADGSRAAWFADLGGRVVAHHPTLLPPPWRRHAARILLPLLGALWDAVVLGRPQAAEAAGPSGADGFGDLDGLTAADLAELVPDCLAEAGEAADTRVWTLDAPPPPGLGYAVPTDRGLRAFGEREVGRALSHALRDEMNSLLRSGRMCWPSPADGAGVQSDGFALLLHPNCFSYRFRHEARGLVFHVVCTGTFFYNYALYFPAADLLVAQDAPRAAEALRHLGRGREAMLRHLLRFGADLAQGSQAPRAPVVQQVFGGCATHIGHYVWQDLAGLAFLLREAAPDQPLPQLRIFNSTATQQFFGPVENIFPMFAGRVTRHEEPLTSHVGTFYRRNQRAIIYTAISVPAELRARVQAAAEASPALQADRLAADAARARPAPVILLGIRAGDRTLDDMDAFAADLLRHLGLRYPGCTVILDGLNDDADRGADPGRDAPPPAPGGTLQAELRLARSLRAVAEAADVRLVDIVNRSALRSVLWCSRADCFVAPLGAALAKYRWLCNTPGLVLSSRWNIEHRADLRIYDAPAALEGSSEMLFNDPAHVRDLTPGHDAGGHDGRGNFVVEREAVFAQLTDLIDRRLRARAVAPAPAPAPDGAVQALAAAAAADTAAAGPASAESTRIGFWRRLRRGL